MIFGERLKELRMKYGLTQLQLSSILDISKSNVSKYEAGSVEPNLDILKHIATYFNVSSDYLLGISDNIIDEQNVEWRFPVVQNRLGTILANFRKKQNLTENDFASILGITAELEISLEQGQYIPSMDLIKKISSATKYEIDFITGATNKTSIPGESLEINGISFDTHYFESENHFRTRFDELCIKHQITSENASEYLGFSDKEYTDVRWNRMPTLSELLRIAYAFNVSMDYLIGKVDTPFTNLSSDELDLILNYRDCIEPYKANIRERAEKLSANSMIESSVAADEKIKEAK